jgi:hypothetical protein
MASNSIYKIRSGEYLITPEALEPRNKRHNDYGWAVVGAVFIIATATAIYLRHSFDALVQEVGL